MNEWWHMGALRAFSPEEPAWQIFSVKDVERRGREHEWDGEPALAFGGLTMSRGRRSGKGWSKGFKSAGHRRSPSIRGLSLICGLASQACEESREGIVFPFLKSRNYGSKDSRDLPEVSQVRNDKVEMRTQISWFPAPVPSTSLWMETLRISQ